MNTTAKSVKELLGQPQKENTYIKNSTLSPTSSHQISYQKKPTEAHVTLAKKIWGQLRTNYGQKFKTFEEPVLATQTLQAYLDHMAHFDLEIIKEALYQWIFIDHVEWPPTPVDLGKYCKMIKKKNARSQPPKLLPPQPWPDILGPKPSDEEVEEFKAKFKSRNKT